MSDPLDDAELIVESAAVVARAEFECTVNEVVVGLGNYGVALQQFSCAVSNAAAKFQAALGPLTALCEQMQAEEAADLAAWDDELPF